MAVCNLLKLQGSGVDGAVESYPTEGSCSRSDPRLWRKSRLASAGLGNLHIDGVARQADGTSIVFRRCIG